MKFHYLIYKNLLLASVFSHMNPEYIFPFSTLLRFNSILFYSLPAYLPREFSFRSRKRLFFRPIRVTCSVNLIILILYLNNKMQLNFAFYLKLIFQ